jgi:hypothetical protein
VQGRAEEQHSGDEPGGEALHGGQYWQLRSFSAADHTDDLGGEADDELTPGQPGDDGESVDDDLVSERSSSISVRNLLRLRRRSSSIGS